MKDEPKTPEEFIQLYFYKVQSRVMSDYRKNWHDIYLWKKRLVKLWHNKFRNKIKAIVCNNTDPKNYHQFMGFELIKESGKK